MTKKDYIKAAAIVCNRRKMGVAEAKLAEIELAFVALFTSDNVRFDVKRFTEACAK